MLIDVLDKDVLEKGFVMPRFTDGIRVIWYGETETLYRFVLFVFYMLGCFQVRFYQYEVRSGDFWVVRETRRFVSFHSIVWNPISILSDIVLDIMNLFYAKIMAEIKVSPRITIDVKDNRAYIIHIRMERIIWNFKIFYIFLPKSLKNENMCILRYAWAIGF